MKTLLLTLCLILTASLTDPTDFIDQHYVYRAFVAPIQSTLKDLRCLTQAIYYEAGNQSQLGKEAVATVVLNRVRHKHYPKTICEVVCQFSFACQKRTNPHPMLWRESKIIAQRLLQNYYHRDTIRKLDDALYFHAVYVFPEWRHQKVLVTRIGQHLFYKES